MYRFSGRRWSIVVMLSVITGGVCILRAIAAEGRTQVAPVDPPSALPELSLKVKGDALECTVDGHGVVPPVDVVLTYRYVVGPSKEAFLEAGHMQDGGSVSWLLHFDNIAQRTLPAGTNWHDQRFLAVTRYVRPYGNDGPYRLVATRLVPVPHPDPAEATTTPAPR
jgi:hypothetical protein